MPQHILYLDVRDEAPIKPYGEVDNISSDYVKSALLQTTRKGNCHIEYNCRIQSFRIDEALSGPYVQEFEIDTDRPNLTEVYLLKATLDHADPDRGLAYCTYHYCGAAASKSSAETLRSNMLMDSDYWDKLGIFPTEINIEQLKVRR